MSPGPLEKLAHKYGPPDPPAEDSDPFLVNLAKFKNAKTPEEREEVRCEMIDSQTKIGLKLDDRMAEVLTGFRGQQATTGQRHTDIETQQKRERLQEDVLRLTDHRNQFMAGVDKLRERQGANRVSDLQSIVDPIRPLVRQYVGDEVVGLLDSTLEVGAAEERAKDASDESMGDDANAHTSHNGTEDVKLDRMAELLRHLQDCRMRGSWEEFQIISLSLDSEDRVDPKVAIEMGWNLYLQGYVSMALDVTETSYLRWRDSWQDNTARNALLMMRSYFAFLCRSTLKDALNAATSIQEVDELTFATNGFSSVMVAMEYFYCKILTTAIWEGLMNAAEFKSAILRRLRTISWSLLQAGHTHESIMFAMLVGNELESTQEQKPLWEQLLHDPRFSGLDRAEICLKVGDLMTQEGDISASKDQFQVAEQIFEELGCAEGKLRAQLQRLKAIRPKTATEIRQMERLADDFEALDSPAMQITALSQAVSEGADLLPWADMVNTFGRLESLLTRTSNRYAKSRVRVEFSAAAILRQEHLGKTIEYLQNCVNVASEETPKTAGQLSMQLGQAYLSLGDLERSLKYAKMAVNMFDQWGLQDMVSDATLALSNTMTSGTPGPNHEAAVEMLKESLILDAKCNDLQRQLKKLEAIVRIEGWLAGSDQGDRHKELQDYWMGEWERIGEASQIDPLVQAQLFMARGEFEKAEELLRLCLVKSLDKKDLRRISKCQHLIFSCLFGSFGSSLHQGKRQTQVGAIVDQATAALAAYQELGPYSVPLEFILQVSHAFESLGQSHDGQERAMLYSEALQYLEIGESISERLRQDLSSSSGLDSLHQKQMLVASSPHSGIFHRALALTLALSDAEKMWRWTQKAKARALSDMVGSQLDSYPRHCPPGMAADDHIVSLLEEEARLVRKLESAVSLEKISTSMELERVRSTMEEHPVLGRLLASRAGKIDLRDLQWLFGNRKGRDLPADAQVVLVDWVVIGDTIVMVTLDARLEPQMSVLDMRLTYVRVWKQRYLSSHTSLVSSDRPLVETTLDQLNELVSGLSQFTHEGDMLVFCPTKTLHAIPLHALKIEGVPVILRNPVVYTASVSLLRQCCEKADSKLRERAGRLRTAFFSTYEDHTTDEKETTKRQEAYACITKLASDFGSEPRVGCDANRANLMKVVRDADIFHFHGHTATHPNILYQCLVLSDGKTPKTSSDEQDSHRAQSSTSPYRPTLGPHKDAFTVRDAFSFHLNLSIASIIACSSGVQDFGAGDEPQGLLSALQYAGCATAIGTLWPVRSDDGRDFARYFFQSVRCQGDTTTSPWNLALSFQKAVKRLQRRKDLLLHPPYYWAAFVMHGAWYL
ncbi:hypothetical protein AbraIFM66951_005124 [Aspergillus brasiliensis]|uniref:CHAT domain-containing protein n=1 Tax=Aspergillus brasiliensis TaxID=319629 RepID=A0A9W5YZF4_9EURO|nr:hypothetical protein AbraCBS73388_011846 [Aspergillus brasiliensis]GKZ51188.1 hypothetical protein AbraIFM66951_005124 [Aspergillus brasiliensis]